MQAQGSVRAMFFSDAIAGDRVVVVSAVAFKSKPVRVWWTRYTL